MLLAASSARAATITVNTTADVTADDGQCTMGEAIRASNTNTASGATPGECAAGTVGEDSIVFRIPGAGVRTIAAPFLPQITEAVTIDGYSQPGAAPNTSSTAAGSNAVILIYLDMFSPGLGTGLTSTARVKIRGLAINPAANSGIVLRQGSEGSVVEGNFIGTNPAGSAAANPGSFASGVTVISSNNLVGGTSAAARNVISGTFAGVVILTSSNNRVEGNLIGTDAAGTTAIRNVRYGIFVQSPGVSNVIGGTNPAARNVISGNGVFGIYFTTTGPLEMPNVSANLVQGNFIGVDVTGLAALPNGSQGVRVDSSSRSNVIGGTAPGARNVISGNGSSNSGAIPNVNVDVSGSGSPGTLIQGNFIGTNAAGSAPPTGLPGVATTGIILATDATAGGVTAGAGNVIAFNTGTGVLVSDPSTRRAGILGNAIHSNGELGIDLGPSGTPAGNGVTGNDPCDGDVGPNNLQNFPVLTSAVLTGGSVTISGALNSSANGTFRLEFFSNTICDASGNGEGQSFLGATTVSTNATCDGTFGPLVMALPAGQTIVTATASDVENNTSEFSACLQAGPLPTPTPSPRGPGASSPVPTLSPLFLALLAATLGLTAFLLLRRSG